MKKILQIVLFFLAAPQVLLSQSTVSRLEQAISSYVSQGKFSGTVLLAKKGQVLLHNGYGYKNAETTEANSSNTIYQVASIAKQFTAAVVLKLQEAGKLSVQDKLSKYYPGYPNGDKITIHHLLSHSSGIYNYTDDKEFMSSDQSKPVSLEYMISRFIDKPLAFEPGTKFSYSNSGYTLLGYIIEKLTGKPYREALESMILEPLKLGKSGYDYASLTDSNKSIGYYQCGDENYKQAPYVNSSILYTTGALYSSTEDLYNWHKALMGTSFLSAESIKAMYTPVAGAYGYGWQVDSLYGKKRVSHSGNVAGFKSNISRIPEADVCVIVLSNCNSSQVGSLVMTLMAIIYDKPYQLPVVKKSVQLSADILKQYTGTYEFNPQLSMTITLEHDKLFIQPVNQPKFEIFAENETSFFLRDFDMQFEFKKNASTGIFDSLEFTRNKQVMTGRRTN
ncbi:MAG: serine hydrolase [Ferruginibacter sp.]